MSTQAMVTRPIVRSVSEADKREHPVVALLMREDAQKYIRPFLPDGSDPSRVLATVLLAIQNDKTRQLGKCTPESLVLGVARIQQWGLELGTTAHLLPFKDRERGVIEATPVADYKGLAELMVGSGAVRHVEARAVYEGDDFEYRYGINAVLDHRPAAAATRKPGTGITHAYCILHLPFGRSAFEVMTAADIDAIRQQYSKQWAKGPLQGWYAKKTVVRQAAKLIPKNPRLANVLATLKRIRVEESDPTPDAPQVAAIAMHDEDDFPSPPDEVEPGDEEHEPTPV